MKPTIYIDTTIPSYYFDHRPSLEIHIERTRNWWDDERNHYEVFTSGFVMKELTEGDFPNKNKAMELISSVPILDPVNEIDIITEQYVSQYLMPSTDIRDALHLAFASYYGMDYLLTWNCAHLANVNKKVHIERLNRRMGLFVPQILTPLELTLQGGE